MSRYDNYIYMEICTVTLETFNGSVYNTYQGYCRGILRSIKHDELSNREKHDLAVIFDRLELIFGMSIDDTNNYILEYLESERYLDFEKVVRVTKDLFPFTGG
jgi:hypothetical protein